MKTAFWTIALLTAGLAQGTLAQSGATSTDSCAEHLNTSSNPEVGALLNCLVEMQREIDRLGDEVSKRAGSQVAQADVHDWIEKAIEPLQPFSNMKGAVIAFDRSEDRGGGVAGGACPIGWTLFRDAGGRMIIGAGAHGNVDENDVQLSDYRAFADNPEDARGGVETHTLTVPEMPTHTHKLGTLAVEDVENYIHRTEDKAEVSSTYRVPGPLFSPAAGSRNFGKHNHGLKGNLAMAGGGQDGKTMPHNNMPPYIALYFCKKEG